MKKIRIIVLLALVAVLGVCMFACGDTTLEVPQTINGTYAYNKTVGDANVPYTIEITDSAITISYTDMAGKPVKINGTYTVSDKTITASYTVDSVPKSVVFEIAGKSLTLKSGDVDYAVYYVVRFLDGETVLSRQFVKPGAGATAPTAPTKEGFTFKGWDKEFANITAALDVNATWQEDVAPVTYKVRFLNGDNLLIEQDVESGKAATAPTAPTKDGFVFIGWDKEFSNVTAAIDVTAQFVADYNVINVSEQKQGEQLVVTIAISGGVVEFNGLEANVNYSGLTFKSSQTGLAFTVNDDGVNGTGLMFALTDGNVTTEQVLVTLTYEVKGDYSYELVIKDFCKYVDADNFDEDADHYVLYAD